MVVRVSTTCLYLCRVIQNDSAGFNTLSVFIQGYSKWLSGFQLLVYIYVGLFKMIVRVLTTCLYLYSVIRNDCPGFNNLSIFIQGYSK